jgi:sugar O-acyltransferase (sialic acid O-acetyltransferase NeuD family)
VTRLALLGAGGHGKVVADAAQLAGWTDIEFFDDTWPSKEKHGPWPVVGDAATLLSRSKQFDGAVVTIGDCIARLRMHCALQDAGAHLTSIVHPAATVSRYARIGAGSVLMAGAIVNIEAVLGQACIVNTGATIDHECVLGDGVHVAPGAHISGNVTIGAGSWIGVGASVRQGIQIGSNVMVGAGAVVVKPVADGMTVVGSPAEPR